MITEQEYKNYFGVTTAPSNFTRLEFIALETIKSIPITYVPKITDTCYENFKKALLEEINFLDINADLLIEASGSSGASLGKFSEGSKDKVNASDVMKLISPITYKILLNCGLLYIGRC